MLHLKRHGMGISKVPASDAEQRFSRDSGRGPLVSDLCRGCDGDACSVVCQDHVLASLDATFASAGNCHRQEQAFGAPGVPGSLRRLKRTLSFSSC
jgi:hypothetical protein